MPECGLVWGRTVTKSGLRKRDDQAETLLRPTHLAMLTPHRWSTRVLQERFSPAVKPSRCLRCPPIKCGPGTSTAGDLDVVLANAAITASKALKCVSHLHGGGTALGMAMRWNLRWDTAGQGFEEDVSLQPGGAGAGAGAGAGGDGLGESMDQLPVVLSCGFEWERSARGPSSSMPPPPAPESQRRRGSGGDEDDAPAAPAASGLWQTDLSTLRHDISEHDDT